MMRRVLLAAAVAAVSLAHAPTAQADYCPATVILSGVVSLTQSVPPRCIPTSHGEICQQVHTGPSAQEVTVIVCVLDPLASGRG